jgi:hypothetical protein
MKPKSKANMSSDKWRRFFDYLEENVTLAGAA